MSPVSPFRIAIRIEALVTTYVRLLSGNRFTVPGLDNCDLGTGICLVQHIVHPEWSGIFVKTAYNRFRLIFVTAAGNGLCLCQETSTAIKEIATNIFFIISKQILSTYL